jgi:hypothetical protein
MREVFAGIPLHRRRLASCCTRGSRDARSACDELHPLSTNAANLRVKRTFRLATLRRLMISRPVDEQLTGRNERLRVWPGAKEGRPWPMT